MSTPDTARPGTNHSSARRAITGAWLGYFVDFFDIYVPIVALTPAIGYFLPAESSTINATTYAYLVLAVTLTGRPIGAFVFGHLADMTGRRRATLIAVVGFGICTTLIGLLPGYDSWGMWAVAALLALRLVDGVFLGGEYTAAVPLAMEYAPKERRGQISARILTGYPLAFMAIAALTAVMLAIAPVASGAYLQWGWRVPFFVGGVLAFAFAWYYRKVEEPTVARGDGTGRPVRRGSPLRELFRGDSLRSLLQVFVLMNGLWLTLQVTVGTFPALLPNFLGVSASAASNVLIPTFACLAVGYLAVGSLSQRYGRRPVLLVGGVVMSTVLAAAYVGMVANGVAGGSQTLTLVLSGVIVVLCVSPWAVLPAYLNERFHSGVRASGFGIGYTLAVILPSLYSFYLLWLSELVPYAYAGVPLFVLGGVLVVVGAWLGPETRDVDLNAAAAPREVQEKGRT